MGILLNLLIILTIITIISIIYYYYASDYEIIYILKNYNFVDNKGTYVSFTDFNLINSFWNGSYAPKNLYNYEAIVNINGVKEKVTIISNKPNIASINGKYVTYNENENVMHFVMYDDVLSFSDNYIYSENEQEIQAENLENHSENYLNNHSENNPEFHPEFGSEFKPHKKSNHEPVFINNDGVTIPIKLVSENVWAPKIVSYKLVPKGSMTTVNNVVRTIFSIPLLAVSIFVEIIDIII